MGFDELPTLERMNMSDLPPFLMTSDPGSFAQRTIKQRKPLIIDRILSHNNYTPQIRKALETFKEELSGHRIKFLTEETSDRAYWDDELQPWEGKTWLEIPWFLAETFFYRRILEIVKYFLPGPWQGKDPYELLKTHAIFDAIPTFNNFYQPQASQPNFKSFRNFCYQSLWGNRGDLSNLHVFNTEMGPQTEYIVLDNTEAGYQFIYKNSGRIAYFLDNTGKELFFDLAFIDYLLTSNLAKGMTCFLKNQPFFVSDARPKDLEKSLHAMRASTKKEIRDLAERIDQFINTKQIVLQSPPFLTTGRMFHQLPKTLHNQLASHDLVILKGDVNYRRLFGDRHWPPTTPNAQAAAYFPTNVFSLRTLKAEIILGLSNQKLQAIKSQGDPEWLINGKRGMVTFIEKQC
jgi:uncharacterized protein with ATP-grasp and redox domains